MHCIRAFFSIVLLVSSLSWFTLRSLLSLSTNINDLFGDSVDFEQFKKDWCKIRRQKIEWREVLSPCMDILSNATLNGNARYATNPRKSVVSAAYVRPAGEHTKLRIQTYLDNGIQKHIGGDSIRVTFRGESTVAANVWDLGDGKYDVLVLLMNPGVYLVDIKLDYTMCAGLRDPPIEWFVNGEHLFML